MVIPVGNNNDTMRDEDDDVGDDVGDNHQQPDEGKAGRVLS